MNALSLFTGIGGFDLAFQREGITVAAQCEIEPHCRELLGRRFPGVPCLDDVKGLNGHEFDGIDIITGGFPCQDISVAGRRAGLDGSRSGLWFEFQRIIAEARPRTVVVENVAGLLTSNGGRDLGTILGALGDLGYGFAYRVFDAQFFGVPQRRRRVFIVGCLGDVGRAVEILFEPEGGCRDFEPGEPAGQEVAGTLAVRTRGGGYPGTDEACMNHVVPVAFHVTQDPITSEIRTPALSAGNKQGCATVGVSDGLGVRKLMPIECERLQGFPDGWTEGFADTHRYRMLGNAVAVPVVQWIARRLVSAA